MKIVKNEKCLLKVQMYLVYSAQETISLIVLCIIHYGCGGTLSLILRKEHRLRVSENRMLRRIFRLKKDK
jgi:hypothetical protein